MPVEIEHKALWALKLLNFHLSDAGEQRKFQLNELEEWREAVYHNSRIYKERVKRWHDQNLKKSSQLQPGDHVLLYNSRLRLFPGKLKFRWSGPFVVTQIFPHGAVEISYKEKGTFKVNGQRLKIYQGGDLQLTEK